MGFALCLPQYVTVCHSVSILRLRENCRIWPLAERPPASPHTGPLRARITHRVCDSNFESYCSHCTRFILSQYYCARFTLRGSHCQIAQRSVRRAYGVQTVHSESKFVLPSERTGVYPLAGTRYN